MVPNKIESCCSQTLLAALKVPEIIIDMSCKGSLDSVRLSKIVKDGCLR